MSSFSYCFVFVCQAGELEIKASLLAASLRHFLHCHYELVAAIPIPESQWSEVSEETYHLLKSLKVRITNITNYINPDYPIGNKVSCLGITTKADKIVFLDSDILCLQPFVHQKRFETDFNAKPADLATYSQQHAEWDKVYRLFNLPVPTMRVPATVSGDMMPPYFNAGFVAVKNDPAFYKTWLNCCQLIDKEDSIERKRPFLDQIALPVAVDKLGFNYDCLDERYNYPAHLKTLNENRLPYFCHYHRLAVILREPTLYRLVTQLIGKYPRLYSVLQKNLDWSQLIMPRFQKSTLFFSANKKSSPLPEAIITGIPRSGTSYFCKLLHQVKNSVAINEPMEVFAPLQEQSLPYGVGVFYRDLRHKILNNIPIQNKLHKGVMIEDTAVIDQRQHYVPDVTRDDFLLTTKNTLAYMARLNQLYQAMPTVPIIACVRHPLDTIASWKNSFPHLAQADVEKLPVGQVDDRFLSHWQRSHLQDIAATQNIAVKRALLWRYLAMCLLEQQDRITIIRYERLVTQPEFVLKTLFQRFAHFPPLQFAEPVTPSQIRQKRECLDEEDKQAINAICTQQAALFGYDGNDF